MDKDDYIGFVLYYGRSRFYNSMQKCALDGLAKYPIVNEFRLLNGISLALGNRVQEGIRELNPLKNDCDLGLTATLVLIYSHNRCNPIDKIALHVLESLIKDKHINSMTSKSAYFAALFYFLCRYTEKAKDFVNKGLKLDSQYLPMAILKAWIEMTENPPVINGNVLNFFNQALSNGINVDATLGLVRFFQLRNDFENAINILNKLSIRFPEINIPLIEKMETYLAAFDWDLVFETASRIINLEPMNIAALRIKTMLLIGRDCNFEAGIITLKQLFTAIDLVEVGNHELCLHVCQLFSRICSRNRELLSTTLICIENIVHLNPFNTEFLSELGFHRLMMGDFQESSKSFRAAIKVDAKNYLALCGLTLCQILENNSTTQVFQQVEFLNELFGSEEESLLLYIKAKIAENSEIAINLLIKSADIHLKKVQNLQYGFEYLHVFNPDFMLQITTELLLHHSPNQFYNKSGVDSSNEFLLKHCIRILEAVIRTCPNHSQAIYLRAKLEFQCGSPKVAIMELQRIFNGTNATYIGAAYLLLAQIQIHQQEFSNASQSLEMALSNSFSVRDNPMYYMLFGIIQKAQELFVDAKKSFLTAMQLLDISNLSLNKPRKTLLTSIIKYNDGILGSFTTADKVTLYLELIDTLRKMSDPQASFEGERLLLCAIEEFQNTMEKERLIIAHAELMLQNCEVAKAINLLSGIQHGHPYYIQAKTLLAKIHLKNCKDQIGYVNCFKELVKTCTESESYTRLGEAYMSIQEPDLAVDAYQKALDMNPHDINLASKLGRTYVKTHQYVKAIKFYQETLKHPEHSALKIDLAELFLKLKQYKNATEALTDVDSHSTEELDTPALEIRTKQFLLLARIHEKSGNISLSLRTLQQARDNQFRIQKRVSVDQSINLQEQHKILSKICFLLAQQSTIVKENEQAIKYYKECLKYSKNDIEILSSLARLHMQTSSMDQCRDVCLQILQTDSNNEIASVMMADLSFRKMEFEKAAYHFSQILMLRPCYWTALARLIEINQRLGNFPEAKFVLQQAEGNVVNQNQCAGLNFCRGLLEWYSGNLNNALQSFNRARRDREWGQKAIYNMIEICINLDGDSQINDDGQEITDGVDISDSRMIALRTAEKLLKELRPNSEEEVLNHRLLRNFVQMSWKQKFKTEAALQDFLTIAAQDENQNLVGPALGIATALIQLKQLQRAKTQLKRFARVTWKLEEAEYMERSWLLLADIYVNSNKFDTAEGLINRIIQTNKSCTKAHELAGYIAEKNQSFRDAAKHYHNAWISCGMTKANIGSKLAFNYMKAKRYADAIEICQEVIKFHPENSSIRKDILNKCRSNLRS